MTCKDCTHNIICSADAYFKEREGAETACVHFKSKSRFIELPCAVGDTVYAITRNTETNIVAIHRGYIGSIDIRSTGNYMFICHEGLDDEPYFKNICGKFDEFGKTVFLTKEEAEEALENKQ